MLIFFLLLFYLIFFVDLCVDPAAAVVTHDSMQ